jgi:cell division protein FtsW
MSATAATAHSPPRGVRELDWLMAAVVCLCCLGLVMAVSIHGPDAAVGPLLALRSQGTKLFVAVVVFLAAALVPLGWYRRAAVPLLVGSLALCAATLLFPDINGARRWLRVGGASFQPVELARFALVLFAAAWIGRVGPRVREFTAGFAVLLAPAALLALVLIAQPDVGNAAFALAIAAVMALVGGVRIAHFLLVGLPLLLPVAMWVLAHGHVQRRLSGFLDVPPGGQVWQSLVAIASGGVLGRGLGEGWMKMGFVPEAGNDFVFAVIGEELGLLGTLLVVGLYATIGWTGHRLFQRLVDPFHRMLVLGFTFAVCMQAAINLAVVTGMAPAKGIDLPFLSSGGSNLAFSLAAVGIIGNAARSDPGRLA